MGGGVGGTFMCHDFFVCLSRLYRNELDMIP